MKIFIGLISSNSTVNESYLHLRTALIPKEIQEKLKIDLNPTYIFKVYNPATDSRNIDSYLLTEIKQDVEAVIFLAERKYIKIMVNVRQAFFLAEIEFKEQSFNPKNYFAPIFSQLLKNFSILIKTMTSSTHEQVMILPVRNFSAQELYELVQVCTEMSMSNSFYTRMAPLVKMLKERKKPRRNTTYRTTYIVDDEEKYFDYGKEMHAKLATGKPHLSHCKINGNFRFGKRIPTDKHFNVTKLEKNSTKIFGNFRNCHDEVVSVKETTHLNMFSNDYF